MRINENGRIITCVRRERWKLQICSELVFNSTHKFEGVSFTERFEILFLKKRPSMFHIWLCKYKEFFHKLMDFESIAILHFGKASGTKTDILLW